MKKEWIWVFICLFLILCFSAWLRIWMPQDEIIQNGEVRFSTVDAYAHMRMADWEYEHFPEIMTFDDLISYPTGSHAHARQLLSYLIVIISKVTGIPLDYVGAYYPAIIGLLLLIPLFIIGWHLFGKWASVIGCLFVSVIPGEILGRTALGHADHDALEMFLAICVLMFLVLAMKRNWLYAIGAGIVLGIYNLNWAGAPLFSLILVSYFTLQTIIDNFRKTDNREIYYIFGTTFLSGLLIYLVVFPFRQYSSTYMLFFLCSLLAVFVTFGFSKTLKKAKPYWYPVSLAGLVGAIYLTCYLVNPALTNNLAAGFSSFVPYFSGFGSTVSEMQPLLFYRGVLDLSAAWNYFALCLYTGIIGLGIFIYRKWREPESLMFAFWAFMFFVLILLQRRYSYYVSMWLGLYTGYFIWIMAKAFCINKLSRHDRKRNKSPVNIFRIVSLSLICFLLIFLPNMSGSYQTANVAVYAMDDAWSSALKWIKTSTPASDNYTYSIVAWWDYGYWIVREAQRPVVCSPGGGPIIQTAWFLFTKEGDKYYQEYMDTYKPKYIILDSQLMTGKFYAIAECAGYTPNNINETLVKKLYNKDEYLGWNKVWESKQKYVNMPEIKIYEYEDN